MQTIQEVTTPFFEYANLHRLALFPLRTDTKTPACENGFYNATPNLADWQAWLTQGYQLGISACLSNVVLIDVDAHGNPTEAWAHFVIWCKELGIDLPQPYGHSPNGGWHFAFQCPAGFDPHKHRGHAKVRISHFRPLAPGEEDEERISVRNRAYNVAPGSSFGGRPYLLATNPPAPRPYGDRTAGLFDILARPEGHGVTGPVPNAVDGVSHDGIRYSELCWWIAKKVARWTSGAESLGNDEWVSLGKRIKLSFPGEDGLEAFLAMSWADQHETVSRRWWNQADFKTEGENLETLPALLNRDVTWMFRHAGGCPRPAPAGPTYPVPAEILERHKREREQHAAAALGPLPNHPELPIGQAETLTQFWAHLPSGKIIHESSRGLWASGSFDKHAGRIKDAMKAEGPGMLASTWLSQHRAVQSMGWDPSEPMIIEGSILTESGWVRAPGTRSFNVYMPPGIVPAAGDVSKWLDHIRSVYPNEAEHIVRWFAHRVQRPGDKVNHALVFIGDPGIGKDTAIEPIVAAIGPHNFRSITAARFFKSDFNGYLKSVMLRIDEVHDLGGESKYAFHDRTKPVLAAPPAAHEINEKFVPHHSARNVCGVILTSNHADALYLDRNDRRHFVCISDRKKEDFPAGYFDDLYAWFENGGNEAVAHFLANLDLSGFNAKAPQPKTAGWHMVVAAGLAPESGDLADAIETMGSPAALTLAMVRAKTPGDSQLRLVLEDAKLRKNLPKRLGECGYVAVANPDARDGRWCTPGGKATIYARQDLGEAERLAAARRISATALLPPPLP